MKAAKENSMLMPILQNIQPCRNPQFYPDDFYPFLFILYTKIFMIVKGESPSVLTVGVCQFYRYVYRLIKA